MKWTGKTPLDVLEMHLTKSGFKLALTKPVKEAVNKADSDAAKKKLEDAGAKVEVK